MDCFSPFSCQLHHIAFYGLKSHTPFLIDQYFSEVSMCPRCPQTQSSAKSLISDSFIRDQGKVCRQ